MSGDWLKKWYRDSYSWSTPEPIKEETWEKIEEKISDWPGYWYAKNAEDLEVKPAPAIWEGINTGIEQVMVLRKSVRQFWMRAVGASMIFALIPSLLADFQTESFAINETSVTPQLAALSLSPAAVEVQNDNIAASTATNRLSQSQENVPLTNTLLANNNLLERSEIEVPANAAQQETNVTSNNRMHISALPVNAISLLEQESTTPVLYERSEENPKIKGSKRGLWNVGGSVSFQHSTLYNPTTQRGNDQQSNIKNLSSSATSYNLSVGRRISNLGTVQATVTLNDKKSQNFMDFVGSQYLEKSLDLTYQSVNVSYSHSLFANQMKGRIGIEMSAGLFASYLSKIEEKWGDEERSLLSDGFKKFDLGGRIGIDGVYSLHPSLDMKLGLFYNNGFLNIFKGVDGIPAHFYRTITSSYGAAIGLRYNL
jgi:hypothetical protein